jgi:hypothetical protein
MPLPCCGPQLSAAGTSCDPSSTHPFAEGMSGTWKFASSVVHAVSFGSHCCCDCDVGVVQMLEDMLAILCCVCDRLHHPVGCCHLS